MDDSTVQLGFFAAHQSDIGVWFSAQAYQKFIPYPTADGSAYGLDLCFNIAGVANPTVPDMVFKFEGADFQLLAENLFVLVDNSATTLCLAMGGSQGFSIIGNIQQQNHLVIYDLEAKKIGFGVAKCWLKNRYLFQGEQVCDSLWWSSWELGFRSHNLFFLVGL